MKGDLDRALADYNQAITIDAKYADAYNNRGTVHLARREFDLAVADFNQAIALQAVTLNGQKSTPYINLGLIYEAKGDYDEASVQFSKAIAIDPKDEIAYAHRNIVDAKKSDYDAAIADFGEEAQPQRRHGALFAAGGEAQIRRYRGRRCRYRGAKALRPDPA